MDSDLTYTLVVLAATFLAVLMRSGMPYLRKAKAAAEADPAKPFEFKPIYWLTAIIVLAETFIATMVLLPTAMPIFISDPTGVSKIILFAGVFGWAYMSNDVLNSLAG